MGGHFPRTSSQFLVQRSPETYSTTGQPKVEPCRRTLQICLMAMWTTEDLQTIRTFNMKNQHFKLKSNPWDIL